MNRYLIIGATAILSTLAAFSVGYYRGLHSERLKNTVNAQEIEISRLNKLISNERIVNNTLVNKSYELESNLNEERSKSESMHRAIERDRDNINRLNSINRNFVRYIQATAESMPITTLTVESSDANSTVPADRVLHYTIDLYSAFEKCRQQNNAKIELWTQLRNQ